MVMSVLSSGVSINSENGPVAPPRRCRKKCSPLLPVSDIHVPTSSILADWVKTHPRKVNRSISETARRPPPPPPPPPSYSPRNHSSSVKAVSLERTRLKGLPPSPIVHQPVKKTRTIAPSTIPRLPAKRASQVSVSLRSDTNTERIPNLPAKTLPRLPPKEKKEPSNLNSGILNASIKKETVPSQWIINGNERESNSSVYEDIKPSGPEFIKVTQNKDTNNCCSSLPKQNLLKPVEKSHPHKLSFVNHLNTLPKKTTNRPLIPPINLRQPIVRGALPPVPRRPEPEHTPESHCFVTSASGYIDLSKMNHGRPSMIDRSVLEESKPICKSQMRPVTSVLEEDTSDINLLNDDSQEPDFGHLVLLQGGVEAFQAVLQARTDKRSTKKRGVVATENSQLTMEMESKLDDSGYEVPASEDKNSSSDTDPTYEEVTFRQIEGKHETEGTTRWCGRSRTFFSSMFSALRSRCCTCKCRFKVSSYRFTKGSTWDWHPSEIPKTTKGSRSSEFVSRLRSNKQP